MSLAWLQAHMHAHTQAIMYWMINHLYQQALVNSLLTQSHTGGYAAHQ